MSLKMARIAVADGIKILACTPHVRPPTYNNTSANITDAIHSLQQRLVTEGIDLKLVLGGDIHINQDIIEKLQNKTIPSLNGSRYFLFEPSHNVMPPHLIEFSIKILKAGYIPVLTHPERFSWIENHYDVITELDDIGVAIQITAGAITGDFGKTAKYWSDRLLAEDRTDIIASDAHDTKHRIPVLSKARDYIAHFCDEETARRLTFGNPRRILENGILRRKERKTSPKSVHKTGFKKILDRFRVWH
ncbi:MAG: capsular biosynthesis protein [Hyphomicrobiales bacterium]|nr:MAG: capsular biosynthesis protein [Hyphomicrobiales bacterium]